MNLDKYLRQITLDEVGESGQQALLKAKVLCIGAGGLGVPVLQYLTAAGIGTIGIVDFDTIELSNLHRQVLYSERDVGQLKVEVAKQKCQVLNSDCVINAYPYRLIAENIDQLFSEYDIIVDCTDNFSTHYLCSDFAYLHNKPLVMASVEKYQGFLITFTGKNSGCYRCLFPDYPNATLPTCEEAGVLGTIPGLFGMLQANEVLKQILKIGDDKLCQLLQFDAKTNQFDSMSINKDKYCELCGIKKAITELMPYRCEITKSELERRLAQGDELQLIDVRNYDEQPDNPYGAQKYPLHELEQHLATFDPDLTTITMCRTGRRSAVAAQKLLACGFKNVKSLVGGI